jgi:hypothetical protein
LVQDGLAQLDGFLLDHAILGRRLHKINCSERSNTSQLRGKSKCLPENFVGNLPAADAEVHRPEPHRHSSGVLCLLRTPRMLASRPVRFGRERAIADSR